MTRTVAAFVMIAASTSSALAQPVALDSFLEQRVAEELASEGTLLARLGVSLHVELVGDKAIVSLVDLAEHRAVASTKLDAVPADRDAAVAAVTIVAAQLVGEVQRARGAVPPAPGFEAALQADRAARTERADAELRYHQEEITFGADVDGHGRTGFHPIQAGHPLEPDAFLTTVGRPDLADELRWRRPLAKVGVFGGGLAVIVGGGLVGSSMGSGWSDARIAGAALLGVGLVGVGVGVWAALSFPASDPELYELAAKYNAGVRKKYGLPTARAATTAPTWTVSPYVVPDGSGVVVAGRF